MFTRYHGGPPPPGSPPLAWQSDITTSPINPPSNGGAGVPGAQLQTGVGGNGLGSQVSHEGTGIHPDSVHSQVQGQQHMIDVELLDEEMLEELEEGLEEELEEGLELDEEDELEGLEEELEEDGLEEELEGLEEELEELEELEEGLELEEELEGLELEEDEEEDELDGLEEEEEEELEELLEEELLGNTQQHDFFPISKSPQHTAFHF